MHSIIWMVGFILQLKFLCDIRNVDGRVRYLPHTAFLHSLQEKLILLQKSGQAANCLQYFGWEGSLMGKLISAIVNFCVLREIVAEDDVEWFRYGLEKRLLSFVMSIPFFVVAVILSNFWVASAFFFSFYFLRYRMSGYHAKSIIACTVTSLTMELLCFCVVYPLLNRFAAGTIMIIVILLVVSLAPYDHPNMNFTASELLACKKSSRIRLCLLVLIFTIALKCNWDWVISGVTLGCSMATLLLCVAYLLDWRNKIWKISQRS